MTFRMSNQRALRLSTILLAVVLLSASACKRASVSQNTPPVLLPGLGQPVRVSSGSADASEPAIAVSPSGAVYVAWVEHEPNAQANVMVAAFSAAGRLEQEAVRVNSEPGTATAWRGDPPTIAVAPDETVYVGWTARIKSESGHATELYLSSSKDRARTFAPPVKVNDDAKPGVHGMHSLAVGNDGRVYVAWLDERNIQPMEMKADAKAKGQHMENNRELFVASSADAGRTFTANQRVATNACPCCKTSLAIGSDHRLYLSWRQVLPGDYRHIAVTSSSDQGKSFAATKIVSDDQWLIPGCPVSGAAISSADGGDLRALWYSAGKNGETGLYWSESKDYAASFQPRVLIAPGETSGTPILVSRKDRVYAVWESDKLNAPKIFVTSLAGEGTKQAFLIADGSLPAAAETENNLVVAYVVKGGQRQEIRLISAGVN